MNIVISSQKGGVGKTTITVHLAAWLVQEDCRVKVIDADNQGAAAFWCQQLDPRIEVVATTDPQEVADIAAHCRDQEMFMVADTQPGLGLAARALIRQADAIMVPLNPAPLDWRATTQVLQLIEQESQLNVRMPLVRMCINRLESKASVHRELEEVIRDHPAGCLKASLSKRTAIEKASGLNSAVWHLEKTESGAKEAAREMEAVFEEFIKEIIHVNAQRTAA